MASTNLYDDDILLWSEQQAEVIRKLAQTRRDLPNDFDVENVAEEIESVGRSEMASVESFLRLLMLHLIKIASVPNSPAASHWSEEAGNFAADALIRFAPSMTQRLDLERAWRLAISQARRDLDKFGEACANLPEQCPYSIQELTSESLDVDDLAARLAGPKRREDDPALSEE